MNKALRLIGTEIRAGWKTMLFSGVLFALFFQVFMLIALIVRFQALPNYAQWYDWAGNILHIAYSTPSWTDVVRIASEEWLLEIGQMNYDYGMGLSVWSLNVVPSRLLILTLMGAMFSLCVRIQSGSSCSVGRKRGTLAALGSGSVLIAMTNATMSWVVCCATPSWVVGLAMLGLGVSTSLALESLGPTLTVGGFSVLLLLILFCAARRTGPSTPVEMELERA